MKTYADLLGTAYDWWAEFDEAAYALCPTTAELTIAYRAKQCGMSPTAAVVAIVETRRREEESR